ncbi:Uu.00g064160.m01.CDS01 [Anthostomella pinea]|uniref:Uu.00g064160.m01.CDS01 n=1 Tax=Anthostomella pinea TaxID=933095 RepID=A0AAI8YN67_9PEZI|nr:Uu.00g064160.m01.CDS01 [Anthostomella pinea]
MTLLPPIPGPKLHPFFSDRETSSTEWVKEIGQGVDAVVWKVEIAGKSYALKLFMPARYDLGECIEWGDNDDEDARIFESLESYENAFFSECRAYGRLKEAGNEALAVQCHGYILFTGSADDPPSSGEDPLRLRDPRDPRPMRAVVKDLIDSSVPNFTRKMVPGMMKDLEGMHRIGIYTGGDLREDAYLNGKLVDFSRAQTVPDERMGGSKMLTDRDDAAMNFTVFDCIIDRWNEEHPPREQIRHRFLPNLEIIWRLRGRKRAVRRRRLDPWGLKRFNPVDYDWEGALARREAAGKDRGTKPRVGVSESGVIKTQRR